MKNGSLALSLLVCLTVDSVDCRAQVVAGRVVNAHDNVAIAKAEVVVMGSARSVVSDSAGRFRIAQLSAGRKTFVVRAIGFDSASLSIVLKEGDTVDVDVELAPLGVRLATMRTKASRTTMEAQLMEFEDRRKGGMGKFLDAKFFAQNQERSLGSLLIGRIPGVRVTGGGSDERLVSTLYGGRCYPQTIVNGIVRERFSLGSILTSDVIGFEFYNSSSTPAKYNATGSREGGAQCGTAIFWIK